VIGKLAAIESDGSLDILLKILQRLSTESLLSDAWRSRNIRTEVAAVPSINSIALPCFKVSETPARELLRFDCQFRHFVGSLIHSSLNRASCLACQIVTMVISTHEHIQLYLNALFVIAKSSSMIVQSTFPNFVLVVLIDYSGNDTLSAVLRVH